MHLKTSGSVSTCWLRTAFAAGEWDRLGHLLRPSTSLDENIASLLMHDFAAMVFSTRELSPSPGVYIIH